MNETSSYNLYVVLLLILLPVVTLLIEWLRRRGEMEREREPRFPSAPSTLAQSPALPVQTTSRETARATTAVPSLAQRRGLLRTALATRAHQRRAIMLMTLLGPCRADEPPP